MTLAASRIVSQGVTAYPHEREAIDFAIQTLPSTDPFHLWALLELLDPSTGRLHEIDLIVLGYSALYVIEVKSGPGRYEGDTMDWYRTAPGEDRPRYLENPTRLTNAKAKILAARMRAKMKNPKDAPWVQPLVFLSATDLELAFKSFGDLGVITRATFKEAMQFGRFPGSESQRERPRVSEPVMRDVAQALAAIGLKPRKSTAFVGDYELGSVLAEGSGFQDRRAVHRAKKSFVCRARIYTVPRASSVERRQQLLRAADRDAQLLFDVREHENILGVTDYVTDAELGPTVLFDAFDGSMPLDAFLRHEKLDFYERVGLVEQIARAVRHCHTKNVVHGALSPEAVLVRRHGGALEVRLFNFQLGLGPDVEATTHWSQLASEPWAIYQAPELREDASNRTPQSDVFSLGALAYLVFTGRAPGASAVEIDQLLAEHGHLDPRGVDDAFHESVAELIALATARSPVSRYDDVEDWIETLLAEVTRPPPSVVAPPDRNPLEAAPGDELAEDLRVEATPDGRPTLGQGATSRVLQVERRSDAKSYALKISLSTDHDERLAQEADELARLRHPRVVQLVDRYTVGGRPCLLLSLAGTETLHRCLAREGTVSLDHAGRYGEDLLSALEYLEEQKILHRDIKPANIGVGSVSNKAAHLTLFDFSLAAAARTDLHLGTAAYRDPFLRLRGAWDHAAERWSAAVTLHEMLTGTRPAFDRPTTDPEARLLLAVERFDPSVRSNLEAFFRRALERAVEARFASADEMRRAWTLALDPGRAAAPSGSAAERAAVPLTAEALAALPPETAVEALPLSPRARNALDRAGFLTAGDLPGLADNRLSAIRGIGRAVAKEILDFKVRWTQAQAGALVESKPFFAGYRGDDLGVGSTGLPSTTHQALRDAGLTTLGRVAESSATNVRALAHRHGFDEKALRELLARENAGANEREHPSTLEGWIEALLPPKKAFAHPRALFGLDPPSQGRLDLSVRALSDQSDVTPAAIYIALGKARDEWSRHGALSELRAKAHQVIDQASGAVALSAAAQALAQLIPSSRSTPSEALLVGASALLRVVAEVEKDEDAGLRTARLDDGKLWLCASDAHVRGVKALAEAADELARGPAVAGPGEASRSFSEAAAGTPLSTLPPERLADIAAAASARAALSARLEIYPRGLEPERALSLSASQLKTGLTPAEIARRVSLRYPAARPLPERPALDALLGPYGLTFDALSGKYVRPGEAEHTSMSSRLSPLPRDPTAHPTEALSMEPGAMVARQFDERLRNASERHELRVLGVATDRGREAALRLGERLKVAPVAFDRALIAAIREQMQLGGVKREELIHQADREGPAGPSWKNLLRLVERAADALATSLLARESPLLLVQPGLIARYRLDGFVARLLAHPRAAPIFVLVPSPDTGGIPAINGDYAIPGLLASQVLWVPTEWLRNQHYRAAG